MSVKTLSLCDHGRQPTAWQGGGTRVENQHKAETGVSMSQRHEVRHEL